MIKIYKNKKIYLLTTVGLSMGLIACFTGIWAIAIVAGVILLLTTLLNPKFGVFVLLFLQLGLTQSTTGLTEIEIIFLIFFCGVTIGWILRQLLKKKIVIKRSFLSLPIFLFLIFCIFSFVKASYNNINIIDWFVEWQIFLVLILFFIILNEFQSKKELKWLIYNFLLVTALICLKDIFLVIHQGGFKKVWQVGGIQYASLYFIMAIPISIAVFLATKNLWLKWFQVPLILLFVFRLSISLSRSSVFALLVMLVIFVIALLGLKLLKNKKLLFRTIALVVLMCIISGVTFLIFPTQINRIVKNNMVRFLVLKDFSSPKNISALTRIVEIKAAWNYAIKQPLLGHGFGFKYQYYRPSGKLYDIPYVHFVPLFFFLKIGLIGVFSIIWLIARVLTLNWQVFKKEKDLPWKLLELAVFSNFIGILILSLFVTNVVRIDSILYLTLAMGIIATLKKLQSEQRSHINFNSTKLIKSYAK